MKTKEDIVFFIIFVLFIILAAMTSSCSREFFCYSQGNVVDLRIPTPDTIGHYEGKVVGRYGELRVDWKTGMKPKK